MERIESYRDVDFHKRIGLLIRDRSENKEDIREVACKALGRRDVRRMLNLGCGYGWFEEVIRARLDLIVGVDVHEENRNAFLKTARKVSITSLFVRSKLPAPIDAPSGFFDLIVAVYSLYFFIGMLPEVKRLLAPGGLFLSITHSEAMLEEAEEFFHFRSMRRTIERFSAENGAAVLGEYFPRVRHVDYENCLVFKSGDQNDLKDYVHFKREFITNDADPDLVRKRLFDELHRRGVLKFNKNDRIFLARK